MKKRLLILLVTIVFTASSLFTTYANSEQSTLSPYVSSSILIDGISIDTTNLAIYTTEASITMYPLRLIAEKLDAKISWDNSKNCVVIDWANGQLFLNADTEIVTINGVKKKLSFHIENKNSRIYVPAEFFSEILGARVVLDPNTKTINIQKPSKSLETFELSDSEHKIQNNLASYLTSLELNRNFSGQILVEQNGNILIDRSYGYSDFENHIKPFNTTSFAIGSVTKQFTAAAIVQLVEKNQLAYDDKVSKYLTDVPFGDKISIHHLLTHTSGLYNFTNFSELANIKPSEMNYDKLISLIKDKPLDFEPGTSSNYSNTGYLVLGKLIEKISGKTLENYMEENIFEPLGMQNTSIAFRFDEKLVEATGYTGYINVVPDNMDKMILNMASAAGFLCSTAEDLYKWDLALQSGKVVSKENLSKIFGKNDNTNLGQFGYGWFISTGSYGEEISHIGSTIGFTSINALFPEKNAHIIILTNKGNVNVAGMKENITNILKGNIVAPLEEKTNYILPSNDLSEYTGSFIAKNIEANIVNNSGELILNFSGQTCRLLAESKEKFYSRDLDIELQYTFNDSGKVTGIVLQAFGIRSVCEKVADRNTIIISEEQLEKYAGTYEIKGILEFVISVKDGKLIFQAEGQPALEATALSETEFVSLLYGIKIKFDSKDNPNGGIIYQGGLQFNAVKIK